jgi:hypothetical protein
LIDSSNLTRNFILFLALLTQGVAVSLAQQDTQNASPHCSNVNLRGGYGYMVNGTSTSAQPYSLVGRFFADGKGGVTGNGAEAFAGVISHLTFTGTYTVNADCTGTANLTFNDGGVAPLEFIIVDDGKTVDIIVAVPNGDQEPNEVGTATRQFNRSQIP